MLVKTNLTPRPHPTAGNSCSATRVSKEKGKVIRKQKKKETNAQNSETLPTIGSRSPIKVHEFLICLGGWRAVNNNSTPTPCSSLRIVFFYLPLSLSHV